MGGVVVTARDLEAQADYARACLDNLDSACAGLRVAIGRIQQAMSREPARERLENTLRRLGVQLRDDEDPIDTAIRALDRAHLDVVVHIDAASDRLRDALDEHGIRPAPGVSVIDAAIWALRGLPLMRGET